MASNSGENEPMLKETLRVVQDGFPAESTESLLRHELSGAALFVWDSTVAHAHASRFDSLREAFPKPSAHFKVGNPENFKSFEKASENWQPLLEILARPEIQEIIVIGGGALSDGVGTLASLWHRGKRWSIVPTTWLSAIDAAHGGKTALNYQGKNQLGSFHLPHRVYLDSQWMSSLDSIEAWHAMGELHKTALLNYPEFQVYWDEIDGKLANSEIFNPDDLLSKYLESAVAFKYSVIEKDPEEKQGLRRILNLGHTLGHILESSQNWAHGYAIMRGLDFALYVSESHFGPEAFFNSTRDLTRKLIGTHPWKHRAIELNEADFLTLLNRDKKHALATDSKEWVLVSPEGKAERVSLKHTHAWQLFSEWLKLQPDCES